MRHFGQSRQRTKASLCAFVRLTVLVPTLAALVGCNRGTAVQSAAMPPVPVLAAKAISRTIPHQLHEIGSVEAFSTVYVKTRVEGHLMAIHFKPGDDVTKGQLLFQLDPRPYAAALAQADANLAKDTAQMRQAETDERRYAYLQQEGVGSREQYDQAHATAAALRATAAADRAQIESARLNLQYTRIMSPLDGRTGDLKSHIGDLIKPDADTPLVVINQVQPIYVDFSLPENQLAEVRSSMAEQSLEVDATLPGSQSAEHGVLNFVDNTVDKTTGTILLKGLFQNENRRLWPGQYLNATLTLNQIPNAVLVPTQAIQTGQNGPFVFVIGTDMKANPRPVVPGAPYDTMTIIQSGLAAGENVVTDGQLRLMPGATVRIKSALGAI